MQNVRNIDVRLKYSFAGTFTKLLLLRTLCDAIKNIVEVISMWSRATYVHSVKKVKDSYCYLQQS